MRRKICFTQKVKTNRNLEKDISEKLEKCSFNIAFMLIFYQQNENVILK